MVSQGPADTRFVRLVLVPLAEFQAIFVNSIKQHITWCIWPLDDFVVYTSLTKFYMPVSLLVGCFVLNICSHCRLGSALRVSKLLCMHSCAGLPLPTSVMSTLETLECIIDNASSSSELEVLRANLQDEWSACHWVEEYGLRTNTSWIVESVQSTARCQKWESRFSSPEKTGASHSLRSVLIIF